MATHVVIAFDGYPRMHVVCNDDDGKPCRHSDRRLPADTVAESYTCLDKYGTLHVLMSQRLLEVTDLMPCKPAFRCVIAFYSHRRWNSCRHSERRLLADTIAESYTCLDKQYIAILVVIVQSLNPNKSINFDVMMHTVSVPFVAIGLQVSMPHEGIRRLSAEANCM